MLRLQNNPSRPCVLPFVLAATWSFVLAFSLGNAGVTVAQEASPYHTFSLQHRPADAVAKQLKPLLPPGSDIQVIKEKNRLLIQTADGERSLVADLVRRFDQPVATPPAEPANEKKTVVRSYAVASDKLEQVAAEIRKQFPEASGVRVGTDPRTGQVIVVGPESVQARIAAGLKPRANEQEQPAQQKQAPNKHPVPLPKPKKDRAEPGVYTLKRLSPRELESQLQRIWGDQVYFVDEPSGNVRTATFRLGDRPVGMIRMQPGNGKLAFGGSDRIMRALTHIVETLDTAGDQRKEARHVVPLKKADPAKIQKAVALLKSSTGQAVQVQRRRDWGGNLAAAIFQPRDNQPQNEQPREGGQDNARQNGQPRDPELAGGGQPGEDGGMIGPVQVEILQDLGVIVLRGHPRDVARVQRIIDEIIKQSEQTRPEVEIYHLDYLNGEAVAVVVTQLYNEVYAPRQGSVSITPLVNPNALVLVGQEESINSAKSLIQQLDRPASPQSQYRVIQLKYMSAVDAEQRINALFNGAAPAGAVQPGAQPGAIPTTTGSGLAPRVQVVSDYRSNTLIVQASPRDMDQVVRLIEELDVVVHDGAVNEVRIFPLRNALAEELAPVLQDALNGQLQGAGQSQAGTGIGQGQQLGGGLGAQQQAAQVRSAMLSLMTIDAETGQVVQSGIMYDVRVTADINSNSLIVTGPKENMTLIGALVNQLDQLPNADAQLKVFTIINGDATTLFNMLQQLFGGGTAQGGFGQGGFGQLPVQTGGDTSLVPLRFAIDVRTNTIIVSGTTDDLLVVEALLARLDLEDVESRRTTVIRLSNAFAQDVADAVNAYLDGQRFINQIDPNVISPFEQIEREVIVVPELVSNSLIISATPNFYDEVIKIVGDLDRRPETIMIQVLIAEVGLNEIEEIGVELGLQDSLLFDRGIGTVGFPFNQVGLGNNADAAALATRETLGGQALSNLAIGRNNADLGYGGLVLSAGNESVNVLLRALHDRRRLQILSRPQVMTLDNLAAFVQVGERVPRITAVAQNVNNTTNSVVLENVGILLGVTPRVSPDGLIVMEINAEKSVVGPEDEGIPIFTDNFGNVIRSPRIEIVTAQTTVSARSGQTVVFAGLITKERRFARRGAPYISDWPVIGPMFRFDAEEIRRTELLIILTPFLLNGAQDVEWMNQREADRMSWCLADVIEVHGENVPGVQMDHLDCPEPSVVYPDMDPTGAEILPPKERMPIGDPRQSNPPLPPLRSDDQSSRHDGLIHPARTEAPSSNPQDRVAGRNRRGGAFTPLRGNLQGPTTQGNNQTPRIATDPRAERTGGGINRLPSAY